MGIDYICLNEQEVDCIGIDIFYVVGFDFKVIVSFFGKMVE